MEGRWYGHIELERDEMMKLAKKQYPDKRARQQWVYGELDRMYPPPESPAKEAENTPLAYSTSVVDDGQIQGLSAIPEGWPELPANASLASEVAWVQANRLRIVEKRSGQTTLVQLDQALSPAPSWAALG